MIPLPIDTVLPELTDRLRAARAVVVVAPPGAGKTTRVPPSILRAGLLERPDHPNLVMLQPRRVAARAAAQRIADEQGWTLGDQVGYQVRFEKRVGPNTRLRVLTEGILTRQLLDDPSLDGIGCVVLDEFHERSIHTDVTIALLREVQQSIRDDLILVVMSATLDAEPIAEFLGRCPILRAEGRMFHVEHHYRPATAPGRMAQRVAGAILDELIRPSSPEGDLLVFLPGAPEIHQTIRMIGSSLPPEKFDLLPLHGSLPFDEQVRALRPSGRRKIILSTNIAETSLTIEGVTTVIDSGYVRVASYDPQRGLDRLELKRISKASAAQRAGRAGRVRAGTCVRLWSTREQNELADFELPEIKRVDLAGTVLALHAWGQPDPRKFGWFDPPPEEMIRAGEQLLAMLGAISGESNGRITEIGKRLLALPVHPRIGRLLLSAAELGRAGEGAAVAALLEEKDIVATSTPLAPGALAHVQGASDLLVRMELLERAEKHRFAAHLRDEGIDTTAARQVARTRDQLLRLVRSHKPTSGGDDDDLLRLPLLAYPDRVVRRRANDPTAGVMVGGGGVRLSAESVVRTGEFLVAIDARHDQRSAAREASVRIASRIEMSWLEEMFPQSIRRERKLVFDESRGRVVGLGTTFYRDLPIREDRDAPVDPQKAGEVLAAALRPRARELIESDEKVANWLARVRFLSNALPEQDWPSFDDALLGDVIAAAAAGKRSTDDVRRGGLQHMLQSHLPYALLRLVDEEAPESIEVPSGNRIRLDYGGQRPILAVRLQELFGLPQTPRLARGRVPVLLHLLGPNFRPVQITDDLASFWKNTYAQVRKDLRVRYPKHAWPDDPLSAKPQAKGGRRR